MEYPSSVSAQAPSHLVPQGEGGALHKRFRQSPTSAICGKLKCQAVPFSPCVPLWEKVSPKATDEGYSSLTPSPERDAWYGQLGRVRRQENFCPLSEGLAAV